LPSPPEPRQPGQRIRLAGDDRTEYQPVISDAVEDEKWKSLEVATTEFRNDGRTEIQKVTGTGGSSFDLVDRRKNLVTESGGQSG
jgi:hypothetical protein